MANSTGKLLKGLLPIATVLLALLRQERLHAEQISVNYGATIRPLTHAGSGFIHSFSASTPIDSLVAPLKPSQFRAEPGDSLSGPFETYDRAMSLGAFYHSEISNYVGFQAPWPGDNGDWTSWENTCISFATQAMAQGKTNVEFELWNEPDFSFFWPQSSAQYLEMWRRGVNAIRSVNPAAKFVGPSLAEYDGGDFISVTDFLSYAKANNVLPDVIAFHEFTPNITNDVANLKAFAAANNIDASRISINEMTGETEATRPGTLPRYFNQIEVAGVESAARSCWNTCFNNSLDGLLTNSQQPRSIWWAYERYARMDGMSVSTTGGASLDAVASADTGVAYALVGKRRSSGGSMQVLLDNLDEVALLLREGKAHVLAERIVYSDTSASAGPMTTINADFTITNGQLLLTLPNFGTYDAYAITITPPQLGDFNGSGHAEAADFVTWRKVGGAAPAYVDWRAHFGMQVMNAIELAAVPEPATWALVLVGLLLRGARLRNSKR